MLNSQKQEGDLDQTSLELETRSVPKHHSTLHIIFHWSFSWHLTEEAHPLLSPALLSQSDWNMHRESCPLRLFLHANQCLRCRHTSSASPLLARIKLFQPDLLSKSVSSYRFCLVHRLEHEKSIRFPCSCNNKPTESQHVDGQFCITVYMPLGLIFFLNPHRTNREKH